MQGYLNKGKEVLKRLLTNGYEAYFFSETVRNSILKIDCDVVNIMTNASVEELSYLYVNDNFTVLDMHNAQLVIDGYTFVISSFPEKKQADNNQPKVFNTNLLENLNKCNFTINALAMTSSGKISDFYDSYKDINKKAIKTVGSAKQRFYDNPIFMLDAIAIISDLNFVLSSGTENGIKKRISHLTKLTPAEISKMIRKILSGRYAKKALITMVKLGMLKGIPFFEKTMKRFLSQAKEYDYDTLVTCAMIENKEIDEDYLNTCDDPDQVTMLFNLALSNPKSKFDSLSLFTYGIDACTAAFKLNKLLGYTRKSLEKKIAKDYSLLPIKKKCDIKFKGEDIMRISDLRDANVIGDMFEELVYQVITGELPNEYEPLEKYACDMLREKGIYFDISRKSIVGIKPRIIENNEEEKSDELKDYDKFINNLNLKNERDYQREFADDFDKDESKFELPGKPRVQMTKADFYSGPKTINNDYDDINYNNYKDPTIPDMNNIKGYESNVNKVNGLFTNGYPFESEFENGKEVPSSDPNAEIYYENNNDSFNQEEEDTNELIKRLEEKLNAQNQIIRENQIEINKQKVASAASKVVGGLIEQINNEHALPSYVDKNDFENSLNEFVKEYLARKTR